MILGDQRANFVQRVENNRRKKRGRKPKYKGLKTFKEGAFHVLKTGKLNDFIHPKEIDPYWGKIYKTYEYLRYLENIYKENIKLSDCFFSEEEIFSFTKELLVIEEHKRLLEKYLFNFFFILFGAVLNKNFYGWKRFKEKFTSKWSIIGFKNIKNLAFDISQTRCSVYFMQSFWLSGLSVIEKIKEEIDTEMKVDENLNRGVCFKNLNPLDENIFEDEDYFSLFLQKERNLKKDLNFYFAEEENDSCNLKEEFFKELEYSQENQKGEELEILSRILREVNLSIPDLYLYSENEILKLSKYIKKEMQEGRITLTDKEKVILKEIFLSYNFMQEETR